MEIQPRITEQLIFIDSRFTTGNPYEYTIDFATMSGSYRNVTKIELLALSFPKIADEHYVIMSMDQCDDHVDSNNPQVHRKSCVVYFDNSTLSTGVIKTVYPIAGNGRVFMQSPPLAQLSKLKVSFTKGTPDNNVITLLGDGLDNHSFLIQLTTQDGANNY